LIYKAIRAIVAVARGLVRPKNAANKANVWSLVRQHRLFVRVDASRQAKIPFIAGLAVALVCRVGSVSRGRVAVRHRFWSARGLASILGQMVVIAEGVASLVLRGKFVWRAVVWPHVLRGRLPFVWAAASHLSAICCIVGPVVVLARWACFALTDNAVVSVNRYFAQIVVWMQTPIANIVEGVKKPVFRAKFVSKGSAKCLVLR